MSRELQELQEQRKRPAQVLARSVERGEFRPRPIGTIIVRARTRWGVMRKVKRGHMKGFYGGASQLAQFSKSAGGGYGVKVYVIRPLPEPIPGWAKGAIIVGVVLMALSGVSILVLRALADMFGMMSRVPWLLVIGAIVAVGLVLIGTRGGRKCCTTIVNVFH